MSYDSVRTEDPVNREETDLGYMPMHSISSCSGSFSMCRGGYRNGVCVTQRLSDRSVRSVRRIAWMTRCACVPLERALWPKPSHCEDNLELHALNIPHDNGHLCPLCGLIQQCHLTEKAVCLGGCLSRTLPIGLVLQTRMPLRALWPLCLCLLGH